MFNAASMVKEVMESGEIPNPIPMAIYSNDGISRYSGVRQDRTGTFQQNKVQDRLLMHVICITLVRSPEPFEAVLRRSQKYNPLLVQSKPASGIWGSPVMSRPGSTSSGLAKEARQRVPFDLVWTMSQIQIYSVMVENK